LAPGNKHDAKKRKAQGPLDIDSDSRKPEDEAEWLELRRVTRASMVNVERDAYRHALAYSFGTSHIYVNGVIWT
jgi:hypothetical protein